MTLIPGISELQHVVMCKSEWPDSVSTLPQVQLTGAGGHGGRCCLQTGWITFAIFFHPGATLQSQRIHLEKPKNTSTCYI